jgi:hypothetical protein
LKLWTDCTSQVVAEICERPDGDLQLVARNAQTGVLCWEHLLPIPEPANWAEPTPAWPGAPTEEIDAFLADDPQNLVVCLNRESRQTRISDPVNQRQVMALPKFACELDGTRFDPQTGRSVWRSSFRGVTLGFWSGTPSWGYGQMAKRLVKSTSHQA